MGHIGGTIKPQTQTHTDTQSREHRGVNRPLCLGKRDPASELALAAQAEVGGPGQAREGAQVRSLFVTNCLIKVMP